MRAHVEVAPDEPFITGIFIDTTEQSVLGKAARFIGCSCAWFALLIWSGLIGMIWVTSKVGAWICTLVPSLVKTYPMDEKVTTLQIPKVPPKQVKKGELVVFKP